MDASRVYVRALTLGCFYSHISTQTFRRALTRSVDSCAEIKSLEEAAGKRYSECVCVCVLSRRSTSPFCVNVLIL